jgi:hypothetical protein
MGLNSSNEDNSNAYLRSGRTKSSQAPAGMNTSYNGILGGLKPGRPSEAPVGLRVILSAFFFGWFAAINSKSKARGDKKQAGGKIILTCEWLLMTFSVF